MAELERKRSLNEPIYRHDISDYENLLKLPRLAARLGGIRLNCDDGKFMRVFWRIYFWINFFDSIVGSTLMSLDMVDTLRHGAYNHFFLLMPCCGFVIVGLTKTYNIARYKPVFENIISELKALWPCNSVTEEEHNIIKGFIKHYTLVTTGYFWCNIALIFFFVQAPFVNLVKRLLGQDAPKVFSFSYLLPFDQYQPIIYEIIVMYQTTICYTVVIVTLSADLLFFFMSSSIAAQLELLAIHIHRMIYVPIDDQLKKSFPLANYSESHKNFGKDTDGISFDKWEEEHLRDVRKIATRHQTLIRLAGDVESMYTFSMMVNFVNSSMIICFCGFCSIFVEKWNEFRYKLFLSSALLQVWMLCWYGQRLLDSSAKVTSALYNCGWYNASKKIRSSILIMLNRSQREIHVTTYGFSIICLASYTTIIKTSWSYFTLLINTYNQ